MSGGRPGCAGRPWLSASSGFESTERCELRPCTPKLMAPMGCTGDPAKLSVRHARHMVLRLRGRVGAHIYWVPTMCQDLHWGTTHLASNSVIKAIVGLLGPPPFYRWKDQGSKRFPSQCHQTRKGTVPRWEVSQCSFSSSVWVRGCGRGFMEGIRCEELDGCSLSPSVTSQSGGW